MTKPPRQPTEPRATRAFAALALALVLACQTRTAGKAASPLFFSRAQNGGDVIATVKVRGIDGTVATLAAMAKDLGLPFSGEDVRLMALARLGLPQPLIDKLDLSRPIGAGLVATNPQQGPVWAVAAEARSPKEAQAWIQALGARVREELGATAVRTAEGAEYWVYRDGALLVGSESLAGLRAAGAHAIAGREAKVAEDVHVRLHPDAMAAASGKDLRAAFTSLRAEALAGLRRARLPLPIEAVDPLLGALLDSFIDPLVEAQSVDVAFAVDVRAGVRLLSRLWPKPNTQLARNLSAVKPYVLDPALRGLPLPAGLFAVNYSPDALARYANALRALSETGSPGLKAMANGLQSLLGTVTSAQSGTFGFSEGPEHTIVAPLRPGAPSEEVLSALTSVLGPEGLGSVVSEEHRRASTAGGQRADATSPPQVRWQRQGSVGRLDITLPASSAAAPEAALLGALSGNRLAYTVTVSQGRLLMTSSPRGEAHLAPLLAVTGPGRPDPELEQVLRETAGREGFIYADLFRLIRPALASAARQEPSLAHANAIMAFIPGIDRLRMPIIGSYVGGSNLHGEVMLPYRTLKNVSNIVGPLLGMGLGKALVPGAAGR